MFGSGFEGAAHHAGDGVVAGEGAAIMSNLKSGSREPDGHAAAQPAFLSSGESSSPLNLSGNSLTNTSRGVSSR